MNTLATKCARLFAYLLSFKRATLLHTRTVDILLHHYHAGEGHNTDEKRGFPGFALIHYTFVRNTRPKRILCIGSRRGFIPAVLALACKENGVGHVDFVDAGYGPEEPKKHWSGYGFWKLKESVHHFDILSLSPWITHYLMTTKQFAKTVEKKYDYVYIDGDHSYDGVKLDYSLFWPRLNAYGFMVFHDVVAKGNVDKGVFGVTRFWKKISSKNAITFPFPKDSGLGLVQKL